MKKQEDLIASPSMKRGNYVKSRQGGAKPIGVVSDIHPGNIAPVEVYCPPQTVTDRISKFCPPKICQMGPRGE